jgi:hypothetical protein
MHPSPFSTQAPPVHRLFFSSFSWLIKQQKAAEPSAASRLAFGRSCFFQGEMLQLRPSTKAQ